MKSLLNSIIKKLFGKKIPKISENYPPYVEKDTECDNCPDKYECIEKGYLLNITSSQDRRQHYIKGIGCICIKDYEKFQQMKLSEILDIVDDDKMKVIIERVINQFGDMTYKEFYQDGTFLKIDWNN